MLSPGSTFLRYSNRKWWKLHVRCELYNTYYETLKTYGFVYSSSTCMYWGRKNECSFSMQIYVLMFPKTKYGVKNVCLLLYHSVCTLLSLCRPKASSKNFFIGFCCFLHSMQLSTVFNVNELSNVRHKQTTSRCNGSCCETQGDLRYRPLTIF